MLSGRRIRKLIEHLGHWDVSERRMAAEELAKMGERGLSALGRALDDEDSLVSEAAGYGLKQMDDEPVALLIDRLVARMEEAEAGKSPRGGREPYVVMSVLADIGDPDAHHIYAEALRFALKNEDDLLGYYSVKALAGLPRARVSQDCRELAKELAEQVHPDIKRDDDFGAWIRKLGSPASVEVEHEGALALVVSLGSLRTSLGEPEEVEELVDMGAAAIGVLIDNLTTSSFVPLILGRIGDDRALEPLMELAQTPAHFDSDPDAYGGYACEMAVHGLGLLGDERALPLLKEIAAETNVGEILMAANQAIGRIGAGTGGVPTGLEGLSDFELEALARSESTPPETLDALVDHPSVRLLAVMNPALPEAVLRRKFAQDSGMHANILLNPSCPSDVLSEIVKLGRVSNARYQAEQHPNWKGSF